MSDAIANLLILEDEPITGNQLKAHFDKESYEITICASATEVIEKFMTVSPTLTC